MTIQSETHEQRFLRMAVSYLVLCRRWEAILAESFVEEWRPLFNMLWDGRRSTKWRVEQILVVSGYYEYKVNPYDEEQEN